MNRQSWPSRRRILLLSTLLVTSTAVGWALKTRSSSVTKGTTAWRNASQSGPVSIRVRADRTAVLAGSDGEVRMELVLKANANEASASRIPTDLLVVLDRSGSMRGEKLVQGLAAVRELIEQLADTDRFALVTYSYGANVALPFAEASPDARRSWNRRLDEVVADGGTNMSGGLDLAYETLSRARDGATGRAARVILISDGLANHGDPTEEGLSTRAGRFAQHEHVLSTVGVGLDFNEYLMSTLADRGTGNYYYLEQSHGLAEVFAKEFSTARETVASALAITLNPGPGVEVADAAGYPLERIHGAVTFRPGTLFAGQERRVWVTYRVPTSDVADYDLGGVTTTYRAHGEPHRVSFSEPIHVACVAAEESFYAGVDKEAWERSVTEESYGRLRSAVARAVRDGRREDAKASIDAYRAQQERMNQALESAVVEQNIQELDSLEADLDEAFQGANQDLKQNQVSKSLLDQALTLRRSGSKK